MELEPGSSNPTASILTRPARPLPLISTSPETPSVGLYRDRRNTRSNQAGTECPGGPQPVPPTPAVVNRAGLEGGTGRAGRLYFTDGNPGLQGHQEDIESAHSSGT